MKPTLPRALALVVAAVLLGGCASSSLIDLRNPVPVTGNAQAGAQKIELCSACHGKDGSSPVPAFANIGGQKIDYLYWELVEYQRGANPDSPMTAILASLKVSDADLRDLSAYYAAQTPAAPSGDATPFAGGEALFRHGDPARGIAPCQGCHGKAADGRLDSDATRYLAYPSLRGQHSQYLARRLKEFRDKSINLSSNDHIMHSVAHNLDDEAITELAGWLQAATP
ncbi:MAG: cytochrome c4 [Dokdonella sp.]|uniref:c-type cytochrome n=1 Tax=Dokdonella sp. TaxID=2291710 RepID=UPI0025C657DA|nr:c-type cytochrome [Dokdonella sp.]MBZ0223858.1 cytochrome c4 [Dokdonella sp.]